MNARENLISLLKRRGYEEAPCEMTMCDSQQRRFREMTGETDFLEYFKAPWRDIGYIRPDDTDLSRFLPYHGGAIDPDTQLDDWGVGHRKTPTSMHMTQMLCPLANADSTEEIEAYPMPTFDNADGAALAAKAASIHAKGLAAVGNMQCTVWETAWYMRGMENLMMDMKSDEDMAAALLDRVTERAAKRATLYAEAGADILFLGDDVGMQRTLMMSEGMYREWLKPRLNAVITAAKAINPEIVVLYHSCGYIEPLIPELIEAGIDALNPVQPECMSFERVHANYGGCLSFTGTIGTQTVMPFGTPEDVRKAVWRNLDIAGEKGGLLASPTHILEPEVPWENILAYVDACREYRK